MSIESGSASDSIGSGSNSTIGTSLEAGPSQAFSSISISPGETINAGGTNLSGFSLSQLSSLREHTLNTDNIKPDSVVPVSEAVFNDKLFATIRPAVGSPTSKEVTIDSLLELSEHEVSIENLTTDRTVPVPEVIFSKKLFDVIWNEKSADSFVANVTEARLETKSASLNRAPDIADAVLFPNDPVVDEVKADFSLATSIVRSVEKLGLPAEQEGEWVQKLNKALTEKNIGKAIPNIETKTETQVETGLQNTQTTASAQAKTKEVKTEIGPAEENKAEFKPRKKRQAVSRTRSLS